LKTGWGEGNEGSEGGEGGEGSEGSDGSEEGFWIFDSGLKGMYKGAKSFLLTIEGIRWLETKMSPLQN